MATLDLAIVIDGLAEQVAAAHASIASVSAIAGDRLPQGFDGASLDALVLFNDPTDLIRSEPVDGATGGALKLKGSKVQPSDRYLELVAAIAADRNAHVFGVTHGWPILSAVARTTTVAEAGGAASAPGGRLAV